MKIIININDNEVTLTKEKARQLWKELNEIFGETKSGWKDSGWYKTFPDNKKWSEGPWNQPPIVTYYVGDDLNSHKTMC